jgi:hypothetical protein
LPNTLFEVWQQRWIAYENKLSALDNMELEPLSVDRVLSLPVNADSGEEHREHVITETNDLSNEHVDHSLHQDEVQDIVSGLLGHREDDLRTRRKAKMYGHAP